MSTGCPLGRSTIQCLPGTARGATAGNAMGHAISHTPWAVRRDGDTHLQERGFRNFQGIQAQQGLVVTPVHFWSVT